MKITNNHPVPMEVLAARCVLQPGESIEIPDTDTAPKPQPKAPEKTDTPAKGTKGGK